MNELLTNYQQLKMEAMLIVNTDAIMESIE